MSPDDQHRDGAGEIADVLGIAGTYPRPGWVVIDAIRERGFTGEVVCATTPAVTLHADRGRIYIAERTSDAPLSERLVAAGALTLAELELGIIRLAGAEHLGRLFERVPQVDRDAVLAANDLTNDECLGWLAAQRVHGADVTPYRHHHSGMHRWEPVPDTASAGVPAPPAFAAPPSGTPNLAMPAPVTAPVAMPAPLAAPLVAAVAHRRSCDATAHCRAGRHAAAAIAPAMPASWTAAPPVPAPVAPHERARARRERRCDPLGRAGVPRPATRRRDQPGTDQAVAHARSTTDRSGPHAARTGRRAALRRPLRLVRPGRHAGPARARLRPARPSDEAVAVARRAG